MSNGEEWGTTEGRRQHLPSKLPANWNIKNTFLRALRTVSPRERSYLCQTRPNAFHSTCLQLQTLHKEDATAC